MVRFQRVAQGSRAQAVLWAQEIATYLNGKFPGNPVQVYVERYGDLSKVYWVSDWDDIAALEARNTEIQTDAEFLARVAKAQQDELFLPGSIHDTLLVPAENCTGRSASAGTSPPRRTRVRHRWAVLGSKAARRFA